MPATRVLRFKEEESSSLTRSEKFGLTGLLLLTGLTFISTITFGWVYDDPPQIPQNGDLQWSRLGYLLTHHSWASLAGSEARFYRPLLSLWFLVNKTLFGLNPHGFHLTTVVVHVAATALAFLIARKVLNDAEAALFAAAVFAVHPLQAEAVSWVSSVNDPLAATLCFLSFLSYRSARGSHAGAGLWWSVSTLSFLLALLAKEVSIVLPAIVLIDLAVQSREGAEGKLKKPEAKPKNKLALAISIYGSVAMVWLIWRGHVLGQAAASHPFATWGTVLLSAPRIALFNLYRVILPIGLSPHYDVGLIESVGGQFLITLSVLGLFSWLALVAAKRCRELWIAYAWLILSLLPTLNLRWMNQDDFVHDRYMYMSMLGVGLLAGFAYAYIRRRWPKVGLVRILAAALVLVLAFASAIQSQYWANDVFLFSRAVKQAPRNEWAQLNYGSALSGRGRFAEAAPHFVESYELRPNWQSAEYAGFAYQHSEDLAQSEHWYNAALQLNPNLPTSWFGLAQVRLEQHRPEEAIDLLKRALAITPDAEGYHYALGMALEQASRPAEALEAYKMELQLHPYQAAAERAVRRLQTGDLIKK
jgi:protein O-mannosyl-transferase